MPKRKNLPNDNNDNDNDNDNNNDNKRTKSKQKMKKKKSENVDRNNKDDDRNIQIQRPDPPPPPPSTLVKLLQKDHKVLKYFQSLQENLEYDVQKWKTRARQSEANYQRLLLEMKQQKQQQQQQTNKQKGNDDSDDGEEEEEQEKQQEPQKLLHTKSKEQSSLLQTNSQTNSRKQQEENENENKTIFPFKDTNENDDAFDRTKNAATAEGANQQQQKEQQQQMNRGIPIDDSMFDFSSSESDNDDNDNNIDFNKKDKDSKEEKEFEKQSRKSCDEMDDSNDSSSIDLANEQDKDFSHSTAKAAVTTVKKNKEELSAWKERQLQIALEKLELVSNYLERLGVSLVSIEEDNNETNQKLEQEEQSKGSNAQPLSSQLDGDELEKNNENTDDESSVEGLLTRLTQKVKKVFIRRRPDQEVIVDLLRTVKALIRIKYENFKNPTTNTLHYYYPFMTSAMIPCYYNDVVERSMENDSDNNDHAYNNIIDPPHPAVEGLRLVQTCLCWIDAYCPILSLSLEEEEDFNVSSTLAATSSMNFEKDLHEMKLVTGMKGRHGMVNKFIQSLRGEIGDSWAVQDRSLRIQTVSVHFSPPSPNDAITGIGHNANDRNNASEQGDQTMNDDAGAATEGMATDDTDQGEKTKQQHTLLGEGSGKGVIPFGPKNHVRLSALVERCFWAKIVATVFLFRQNYQEAAGFAWDYLSSTTPALLLEDYPKLPPVQSLCILESILSTKQQHFFIKTRNEQQMDRDKYDLYDWMVKNSSFSSPWVLRILHLTVSATASIQRIRLSSADDRISDVAKVELAAFDRFFLQRFKSGRALSELTTFSTIANGAQAAKVFIEDLLSLLDDNKEMNDQFSSSFVKSLVFVLTLLGDKKEIKLIIDQTISKIRSSLQDGNKCPLKFQKEFLKIIAASDATRQTEIRTLDDYREICQSPRMEGVISSRVTSILDQVTVAQLPGSILPLAVRSVLNILDSKFLFTHNAIDLVPCLVHCCQTLCDGESVRRLLHKLVLSLDSSPSVKNVPRQFDIDGMVHHTCQILTVRVINLERRRDRMASFMAQAMQERLLVCRAVTPFNAFSHDGDNNNDNEDNDDVVIPKIFGNFAIDGQGRPAEIEQSLAVMVGGQKRLDGIVEPHWRPYDLRPFDDDAPDSEEITVRISSTEKACALSHIASWKGVVQSLKKISPHFPAYSSIHGISGYASGPALFPENEHMDPAPVCVILEDDAILVDRFTDRLKSILEELPRDFHFCSLGYSRPKTAPMIDFSSQVGIPTAIWYLTGYVLSLEGARYLLNRLPVRGPVDSWIGLSMFANWDNAFGHALGVGVHSKAMSNNSNDGGISRKDIRKALRFRAFAATVPLCSQKVGSSTTGGSSSSFSSKGKKSWRQRDTDIVYSGKP